MGKKFLEKKVLGKPKMSMKITDDLKKHFEVLSRVRSNIFIHSCIFDSAYNLNSEKLERKMSLNA